MSAKLCQPPNQNGGGGENAPGSWGKKSITYRSTWEWLVAILRLVTNGDVFVNLLEYAIVIICVMHANMAVSKTKFIEES